jgi:hypothetical protein
VTTEFDNWLTAFFQSYYCFSPVSATFIGVHEYDDCLPDFSQNRLADRLSEIESLLRRSDDIAAVALTDSQRIDKRLAEGFLKIQRWEIESGRFYASNPSLFAGEAIFGVMSQFLSGFGPLAERVAAATARLEAIPQLLARGEQNLREVPNRWCRHALGECDAAIRFLADGAVQAAGECCSDDYRDAVQVAARAFSKFREHLRDLAARGDREAEGCGDDALALHLRHAHCLEQTAESIAAYARSELELAKHALAERCRESGCDNPAEAIASLADQHPDVENYYQRYQQTWDAIKALADTNELLTWPDFPIRYAPQPQWAWSSAPDLYFLYYRSPAAFNRPAVHDYLVTPIDVSMPAHVQRERLRANNDSAIKLNHVVHHGGIGHHVQNWHAFRAQSQVGRIAAIDCASRIAMHCGGTMAEGWACYATDLVAEFGGLTPLEEIDELRTRARMCCRAIVDVSFHRGDMSFADAVRFYENEAGMSQAAALYEATRNSMYPGSALMYIVGTDAIHQLRRELEVQQGSRFSLREFHDRFLAHGSLPVALIAESMRGAQNRGSP